MRHLDPLHVLAIVNGVLTLAVIALGVVVWRTRVWVIRLNMDKGRVINEQLIELWKKRRKRLPVGSAKHRAYTRRLEEVGALDGD